MRLLTDLNLEASVVRLDLGLPTSTIFMYSVTLLFLACDSK